MFQLLKHNSFFAAEVHLAQRPLKTLVEAAFLVFFFSEKFSRITRMDQCRNASSLMGEGLQEKLYLARGHGVV